MLPGWLRASGMQAYWLRALGVCGSLLTHVDVACTWQIPLVGVHSLARTWLIHARSCCAQVLLFDTLNVLLRVGKNPHVRVLLLAHVHAYTCIRRVSIPILYFGLPLEAKFWGRASIWPWNPKTSHFSSSLISPHLRLMFKLVWFFLFPNSLSLRSWTWIWVDLQWVLFVQEYFLLCPGSTLLHDCFCLSVVISSWTLGFQKYFCNGFPACCKDPPYLLSHQRASSTSQHSWGINKQLRPHDSLPRLEWRWHTCWTYQRRPLCFHIWLILVRP